MFSTSLESKMLSYSPDISMIFELGLRVFKYSSSKKRLGKAAKAAYLNFSSSLQKASILPITKMHQSVRDIATLQHHTTLYVTSKGKDHSHKKKKKAPFKLTAMFSTPEYLNP